MPESPLPTTAIQATATKPFGALPTLVSAWRNELGESEMMGFETPPVPPVPLLDELLELELDELLELDDDALALLLLDAPPPPDPPVPPAPPVPPELERVTSWLRPP